MDPRRFDALTKSLSVAGTRRGLVRRLAAVPLGVVVTALLGDGPEATAKKKKQQPDDDHGSSHRRQRRKAKHRHQTGNRTGKRKGKGKTKHHRPQPTGCTPESTAQTCAGTCAKVPNTCGTVVDCGSCVCGTCQICQSCNAETGVCEPNPALVGQSCGECRTCDDAGQCATAPNGTACDGDLCTTGETCQGGVCGGGAPVPCPPGESCQGGVCGVACGGDFCPTATGLCDGGACVGCTVCATCTHTTVQQAIGAVPAGGTATIHICAGTYLRSGTNPVAAIGNGMNLTLIGAGVDRTILDGNDVATSFSDAVLTVRQSTTQVRQLTVRGANGSAGIDVRGSFLTTLQDVSVTDNHRGNSFAGGILNNLSTLILNAGTSISGNTAFSGAGIGNAGDLTLNAGSSISGNEATNGAGIINVNFRAIVRLNAGSSVTGNEASNTGGGIFNNGTVVRNGGTLSGNDPDDCVNVNGGTGC